jgi:hypothetical protein
MVTGEAAMSALVARRRDAQVVPIQGRVDALLAQGALKST